MSNEMRDLYDTFLDSGELYSVLPDAEGIWEKDMHRFIKIQERLSELVEDEDFESELLTAGSNWKEFVDDLLGINKDVEDDQWMDFI